MITKKDALDYFNQILKLEEKMALIYHQTIKKISDTSIINKLKRLEQEEYEHADAVQNLKDLLKQYWKD